MQADSGSCGGIALKMRKTSLVLLGAAGHYMAIYTWGLQTSWIIVSLVSLVLFAPVNVFVLDPRMRALYAKAGEAPDGPLSDELVRGIHDPIIGTVAQTLTTVLVGIVFLMTNKPPLVTSMLVMVLAFLFGLFVSLPLWSEVRSRARGVSVRVDSNEGDPYLRKTIWTRRW